jgi:hypothetical protein
MLRIGYQMPVRVASSGFELNYSTVFRPRRSKVVRDGFLVQYSSSLKVRRLHRRASRDASEESKRLGQFAILSWYLSSHWQTLQFGP